MQLNRRQRGKKNTTLAVLRHALGPYEGREEIFAATVKCSVSWVKKVSAGIRPITPRAAHKVSIATGVSADWLMSGDLKTPILCHDNIQLFTEKIYHSWRNLSIKPIKQIDSGVIVNCVVDMINSVIASKQKERINTAINDLWKFSKIMKIRYGTPKEHQQTVDFYTDTYKQLGKKLKITI